MSRTEKFLAESLTEFLILGVSTGITWVAAWAYNPRITSGTVWFVGLLFGLIVMHLSRIQRMIKSEW